MLNLRDKYELMESDDPRKDKAKFIQMQHEQLSNMFYHLQSLLKGSDIYSLEINQSNVIANFKRPKISLELNCHDSRSCALETINFKRYEALDSSIIYGVFDYLNSLNKEKSIFFDIGANEGIYTLSALKRKRALEVHAFEAVPETMKRLKSNLILNKVSIDQLNNVAISNKIGEQEFTYVPFLSGSSSFVNLINDKSATKIKVKTKTLDFYCDEMRVIPDFIKVDVEGSEHLVMEGFKNTLKKIKAKPIIFIEILRKWSEKYGVKANDLYQDILSIGFKGYVLDKKSVLEICNEITEKTISTNFLFLPEEFKDLQILKIFIKQNIDY